MPTKQIRIGGSFAPPLDEDGIDRYEQLFADFEDRQIKGYVDDLIKMLRTFRETGESTLAGTPHPVGRGTITPLEDAEVERIWDVVPWPEECDIIGKAFDKLDPVSQKDHRNAAYHLLWYGVELSKDREPMTADRL